MTRPVDSPSSWRATTYSAFVIVFGLYALAIVNKAWVTDDAYITFRTVDNLANGYGLTWNPPQRVQVYTHPLWMFLTAGVHLLTKEFFFTTIYTSLVLSCAAVLLFAFTLARSAALACLGVAVLGVSRAFTDYSTSGLENPLTHFLVVLFLWRYFGTGGGFKRLCGMTLAVAMLMTNRLDLGFLVLPPLVYDSLRQRVRWQWLAIVVGFLPLVLWEAFALLYYGLLLPNTAYAKLNTGIGQSELVLQGLRYLGNSLRWDPIALLAIGFAVTLTIVRRNTRGIAVCIGICLYLLYVVSVGGDFMSGRFLSAPLFAAVVLLGRSNFGAKSAWAATLVVLLLNAVPFYSSFGTRDYGDTWDMAIDDQGVSDERVFYLGTASLRGARRATEWPQPSAAAEARELLANWQQDRILTLVRRCRLVSPDWPTGLGMPDMRNKRPVVIRGAVGYLAFYVGPHVHVLDFHALSDPLLARLPAITPDPVLATVIPRLAHRGWRIGHFTRLIPDGYPETLSTGVNHIRDPNLRLFHEKVALMTCGDLFDPERLTVIWRLNFGRYDDLVSSYVATQPERMRGLQKRP